MRRVEPSLHEEEAASGFEPLHGGFADLSLSHLGTPPVARLLTHAPAGVQTSYLWTFKRLRIPPLALS